MPLANFLCILVGSLLIIGATLAHFFGASIINAGHRPFGDPGAVMPLFQVVYFFWENKLILGLLGFLLLLIRPQSAPTAPPPPPYNPL